ncbi:hypothetical protein B566_EDAN009330 [Ephemera danica]|nr:hypothetical protein B566_EDAN009330 [Ephemera danica]
MIWSRPRNRFGAATSQLGGLIHLQFLLSHATTSLTAVSALNIKALTSECRFSAVIMLEKMRGVRLVLLCFLFVAKHAGVLAKLPPGIKTCPLNDPQLNECFVQNANIAIPLLVDGNPSLGLPTYDPIRVNELRVDDSSTRRQVAIDFRLNDLDITGMRNERDPAHGIAPSDPLYVPEFSMDDANSGRQVALSLAMKDLYVKGLAKHVISKMNVNLEGGVISWKGFLPRLELKGQYEVSGRVLILPIAGKGGFNMTLIDIDFTYELRVKNETRNGKNYLKPYKSKTNNMSKNMFIHLEGLFNGDKQLGDHMNVFLNENWREMERDIGPSITEAINMATLQFITRLCALATVDELFPLGAAGPRLGTQTTLDLESGAISWSGTIPRLELVGDYKATGRVLILPITGNGAMNFTLEDVKFTYSMRMQEGKNKNGRPTVTISDNHLVFKPTHCYIKLDNLFGDPVLSARMNEFLNENWKALVDELGPPIGEVLNAATLRTIQSVIPHMVSRPLTLSMYPNSAWTMPTAADKWLCPSP